MGRARVAAKAVTEQLVLSSGLATIARRRNRGDVLILTYHNVVPDGTEQCGDAPLHLPRSRFAAQLDALARTHDVVPLADALGTRGQNAARPRAVVTFDDAYRGALTHGVAELERRGMTATVFVAPGFVGGNAFWWDRIVVPARGSGGAFRARAIDEVGGRDAAVSELAARCGFHERDVPPDARCASEAEIAAAVTRGTVAVGSHTWSHPNLATLSGAALRDELTRPLTWLRDRFPEPLPVLAYPYGRFSEAAVAAARDAGYAAALANDGGWMRSGRVDALRIPRVDIPSGLSDAGFVLRAAGLFAT